MTSACDKSRARVSARRIARYAPPSGPTTGFRYFKGSPLVGDLRVWDSSVLVRSLCVAGYDRRARRAVGAARKFHPRLGSALSDSLEFAGFTLSDAQLVIARRFGFPSWPKLKARLERAGTAEGTSQTGAAMRIVAAALTARFERRFDQFGSMLSPEIEWRGLPDENGQIPRCRGRAQALERMRPGLLRQVAVSALVEEGDRVLARVHRVDDAQPERSERCLVAEVHDGQITRLSAYARESEAVDALRASSPPELDQ